MSFLVIRLQYAAQLAPCLHQNAKPVRRRRRLRRGGSRGAGQQHLEVLRHDLEARRAEDRFRRKRSLSPGLKFWSSMQKKKFLPLYSPQIIFLMLLIKMKIRKYNLNYIIIHKDYTVHTLHTPVELRHVII